MAHRNLQCEGDKMRLIGWLGDGLSKVPIYSSGGGGPLGILFSIGIIIAIPALIILLIASAVSYPFRSANDTHYQTLYNQVEQVKKSYQDDFEDSGIIKVNRSTDTINKGYADEHDVTKVTGIEQTITPTSYSIVHSWLVSMGKAPLTKDQINHDSLAYVYSDFFSNSIPSDILLGVDRTSGAAVIKTEYLTDSYFVGPNSGYVIMQYNGERYERYVPTLCEGNYYSAYVAYICDIEWSNKSGHWVTDSDILETAEALLINYNARFGTSLSMFTCTKRDFETQISLVDVEKKYNSSQNNVYYEIELSKEERLASWLYEEQMPKPPETPFWLLPTNQYDLRKFESYWEKRPVDDSTWVRLYQGVYRIGE